MPRVHFVNKARKDNPAVKKGESYYWWEFRYGGKRYSATHPRQSQLTQSEFLSQMYSFQEQLEDATSIEDIAGLPDEIRQLGEEQTEKKDNMPESLQYGPTGELLDERAEAMETWASELEDIINESDDADDEEREELLERAQMTDPGI